MKKSIQHFKNQAIKNLGKIKGGGGLDGPIDRDKIKTPKMGK